MKKMKRIFVAFLVTLLSIVSSVETMAQCAMCRATVESNLSNGTNSVGAGLNKGILYLLSMPYLAIGVLAYLWYRSSKANYEKRIKTAGYTGRKVS